MAGGGPCTAGCSRRGQGPRCRLAGAPLRKAAPRRDAPSPGGNRRARRPVRGGPGRLRLRLWLRDFLAAGGRQWPDEAEGDHLVGEPDPPVGALRDAELLVEPEKMLLDRRLRHHEVGGDLTGGRGGDERLIE